MKKCRRVAKYGMEVLIGDLILGPDAKEDGDRAPVQVLKN